MFSTLLVPKLRGAKNVRFFSFPPRKIWSYIFVDKIQSYQGMFDGFFS